MGKWASNKKDHLIFENWRKFLNEAEVIDLAAFRKLYPSRLSAVEPDTASVLSQAGGERYDTASDDDVVTTTHMPKGIDTVSNLKPSQTSMNISKAMTFVIHMLDPDNKRMNAGGDLGAFVSNDNFIMDGHHRWIASAMVKPGASLGGYLVDLPGENLVAILNAMTKGKFKVPKGKEASGGFNQFQPGPIKGQLELFFHRGINAKTGANSPFKSWHERSPERVQELIQQWTGQQGPAAVDAAVSMMVGNLSNITMAPPSWAHERPDMPVISGAANVKAAVAALNQGLIDFNPPYSDGTKQIMQALGMDTGEKAPAAAPPEEEETPLQQVAEALRRAGRLLERAQRRHAVKRKK